MQKDGRERIAPLSWRQRLLFLLAVVLAWPALLNGTPVFFSDTSSYLRGADAVALKAGAPPSIWSDVVAASDSRTSDAGGPVTSSYAKNIILGRSIFYGLLLYAGVWFGTFAVPVLIQALAAGATIIGAARHILDPERQGRAFVLTTCAAFAVAAATSLPFFVSFLMPDVFAGLALLAGVTLLTGWRRERFGWRIFWLALLAFAALAHTSHVLLMGGLATTGVLIRLVRRDAVQWAGVAALIGTALVGVAGDAAFSKAIQLALDRQPVRPPFLAIRLIVDGPGRAYLAETCPRNGLVLCRFNQVPPASSDVLMWSPDPRQGIFTAANAEDQRLIARQQGAFVAAVVRRDPAWVAGTMIDGAVKQLTLTGLEDFRTPLLADPEVAARLPRSVASTIRTSPAEQGKLPTAPYRWLIWPMVAASLGALVLAARRAGWQAGAPALLLVAGVLLNAAVCGGLSNRSERYQDRVIWLIAVGAVLIAGMRRPGERTDASA